MKKFARFLVPLLLAALIIASCGWYLFVYDRDFSRDMLLQQARTHDLNGNKEISSLFYDLAYDYSGQDQNVAIELANQYKADGNYTKAEYTLTNALHDAPTAELYMALCKTYVEQDKLLDAVNMLNNITHADIKAQLDAQRPAAPTADHDPGFYSQYIDVALSASGTLYCTTTGEYPSTEKNAYTKPITLSGGETIIYAICVGDNGLVSPLTVLGYTVNGVIEPAIFMDATMESTVRGLIDADPNDIVYTNELWSISEFTVPEGVTSLEDLRHMPYLKSLTVQDRKLETLSNLSSLSHLEKLDLTGCRFPADDLAIVAALPKLTSLTISDCGLSTISDLIGAQNLTYLDISKNGGIRNLESIRNMTSLKELYLQNNAVVSLEQLSGLLNLEKLDVSYNALTTLSPISGCIRIHLLKADGNQLTGLEGLDSLALLAELSLEYNQLTDISALSGCTELRTLSIANNQVADITPLSGLNRLEKLDFSYNTVAALPVWDAGCTLRTIDGSYNSLTSLDTLAGLDTISYIYMDYNKITNVNKLADCYNLVQLNVFGNKIKDVSALTEHDIIVNYNPT